MWCENVHGHVGYYAVAREPNKKWSRQQLRRKSWKASIWTNWSHAVLDLENMVTGIRNSGTESLNIALVDTG